MTLLFITLPAALIIAAGAVAAFMWAARNDQYEDLDTPPRRMLLDDPTSARARPAKDRDQ
jgi:cbb3-type cytochrome oxidase maturation protein